MGNRPFPAWVNDECVESKRERYKALELYRALPSEARLTRYLDKKREYNILIKTVNQQYKVEWMAALEKANSPADFWELLKRIKPRKFIGQHLVPLVQWENFWKQFYVPARHLTETLMLIQEPLN